ncbi:TPA: DUF1697 domain-containing protein [Streptococcus suis]|nr:DUF1697 domain-containing protein [Streptococcus suis]
MVHYTLLLRGVNLGKENKVIMPVLKEQLASIGLLQVDSYINTGNLFFYSDRPKVDLVQSLADLLQSQYDFEIPFVLLESSTIIEDADCLPHWWQEENYRCDALFYLPNCSKEMLADQLKAWQLGEEEYHIGETALFWRVATKEHYTKTAHARKIMTKPFNQAVTLRNANTFNKIVARLQSRNGEV